MEVEANALSAFRDQLALVTPDAAPAILPGVPVALAEANVVDPRFIAASPHGAYPLAWAISQQTKFPVPIAFDADPFQTDAHVYTDVSGVRRYLCLDKTFRSLTHELFFHADPNALRATFRATGSNDAFTLVVTNAGSQQVRAGPPAGWAWLSTTDTASPTKFSTAYFGIDRDLLFNVMRRQWSGVDAIYVGRGDQYYGPVPRALATSMWQEAQLSQSSYVPGVFDCEDFAYVYKGTVCRRQLSDHRRAGIEYAYAVGCVVGSTSDPRAEGHAVNLFVDETFTLNVLEPQTGEITPARSWGYIPREILF